MKTFKHFFVIAAIMSALLSCNNHDDMFIESPGGDIRVFLEVSDEGKASFSVSYIELPVIDIRRWE
jgi:hypothetical protein